MPAIDVSELVTLALKTIFWLAVLWGGVRVITTLTNKGGEVLKARRSQASQEGAPGAKNSYKKFGSAYEMLCSMEEGLIAMANDIRSRCERDHIALDSDTGYKTVIERLDQVKGYREKLETNPIYATLDNIGFPILKNLGTDVEKYMKTVFKPEK